MNDNNQAHIMQINMKNGVNVQIGVKDFAEFKAKRELILLSKKEFIDIIDTCTIKKSEVSLIEYFIVDEPAKKTGKKGGKNKWQRK